ncbi:NUDIX hydrolase [Piscibacillus halophilus]|uniref:NUDIX hydrolase n=1 Tax=Piscibacillus halophilus TaxID=571933 RepID=UPI002409B40A|nr:NUDIX hydrolase [Piscibacillus halophilus]
MGYVEDLRRLVGHRPLILVGTVVVVIDELGRVLLQQRRYPHGVWGLPGGLMELAESTEDVGRREVLEETGLTLGDMKLIDIYSGSKYFTRAQNGDEFYSVTAAYVCDDYSGKLTCDQEESLDLAFFHLNELPEKMIGSHVEAIRDYQEKYL